MKKDYAHENSKRSFRYAIINLFLIGIFVLLSILKPEKTNRSTSLLIGIIFCILSTLSFSGIYLYHKGTSDFSLWKRRLSFFVHNAIAFLILLWFLAAVAYLTGFIK